MPDPTVDQWQAPEGTVPPTRATSAAPTGAPQAIADSPGPRPGDRVGEHYEIIAPLGAGGMGQVYRVRHLHLDRAFALKIISTGAISPEAVARFKREMKAAGRTHHPNVILATDAGESQGRSYLVMELVPGTDLARLVKSRGPLSVPDACELVRQAALGLQAVHEAGLVHRDIKPSNLMLTPDGVVKVLDLGLARLVGETGGSITGHNSLGGTADYMAPEQADDLHSATITADLYSLGCTLYCLLAGHPPFGDGSSVASKLIAHRTKPVPPIASLRPELGPMTGLVGLLERLLAKEPIARPQGPREVAEAIEPFCVGHELPRLLDRAPAEPAAPTSGPTGLMGVGAPPKGRRSALIMTSAIVGLGATALLASWSLGPWGRDAAGPTGQAPVGATSSGLVKPSSPNAGRHSDTPLRIESFAVQHYRGVRPQLQGEIGALSVATRFNDHVKVLARLSAPAYCYLIALNPDGSIQFCPRSAENTPPEPTDAITYPADPGHFYTLSDGTGLQSFVLIASEKPLPAFSRWAERATLSWSHVESDSAWLFDGERYTLLGSASRGSERRLSDGPPAALEAVCDFLRAVPDLAAVQVTAFPVRANEPAADAPQ